MSTTANVINGSLSFIGNIDTQCFTSWSDFVQWIQDNAAIQIPADAATNVLVSNVQPLDNQTGFIWFRTDNSGNFLGVYVYSGGQWIQMFPAPNQITLVFGNSSTPPAGYATTEDYAGLTTAQKTFLKSTFWNLSPDSITYDIFTVIFVGL